jgi:Tol biopolymer transport system component
VIVESPDAEGPFEWKGGCRKGVMKMFAPQVGRRSRRLSAMAFMGLVLAVVSVLLVGGARSATPAPGLIAFARDHGIYVMRADGSGVRALWHGGQAQNLTWSPDGRTLAFEANRAIWVVDAQTKHLARVVSGAASPTWSPDGRRIAFTRLGTKANPNWPRQSIWVVNADGSRMRRLVSLAGLSRDTKVDAGPNNLDWSPNGRQIVLSAYGGWLAWIYVVNVDGTHLQRLSEIGWAWDDDPEWSPDGHKIVYSGTPPTPRPRIGPNTSEIRVTDPRGRSHVRLTRNWVADESPAWSPDGSKIAFVRTRSPKDFASSDIYVMNADGSGVTRLTHNHIAEGSPAWQPLAAP